MSPGVIASSLRATGTVTVFVSPAASSTRAKPTRRLGGTTTSVLLTGWETYTGTMSTPARAPVFATVNVASMEPEAATVDGADRPLVVKVVYDRPKPNG